MKLNWLARPTMFSVVRSSDWSMKELQTGAGINCISLETPETEQILVSGLHYIRNNHPNWRTHMFERGRLNY